TQTSQPGGHAVADKRVDFAYNALGDFTTIKRFGNLSGTNPVVTSTYTYNDFGLLTGITHKHNTTILDAFTTTYDAFGRVASFTSTADGETDYTYDATNQLTAASGTQSASYSFDANGNQSAGGT